MLIKALFLFLCFSLCWVAEISIYVVISGDPDYFQIPYVAGDCANRSSHQWIDQNQQHFLFSGTPYGNCNEPNQGFFGICFYAFNSSSGFPSFFFSNYIFVAGLQTGSLYNITVNAFNNIGDDCDCPNYIMLKPNTLAKFICNCDNNRPTISITYSV